MTQVADLERAMAQLAPPALAQPWDRVGLLAGRRSDRLRRVLLCIDMTSAVVKEAVRWRAGAVVAYHPPLFKPLQSLRADDPAAAALYAAVRAGIAVYSPHTALDAAPGGTGDALARLCGAEVLGPLAHASDPAGAGEVKVTTFVPARDVERVAEAMFAAGAGRIGRYEKCSFRTPGQGTFFGGPGTDPAVGRRGRLERVEEIRLEVVCSAGVLAEVVASLRRAHPYEEPAFDVYTLAGKPLAVGIGRMARLRRPMRVRRLAQELARAVGTRGATIVGPARRMVRTMAILVGSAGRVWEDFPRSAHADVLVTGEMRHHDALALLARGGCAIALGHWSSERPVLESVRRELVRRLRGVAVRISRADGEPFVGVG